MYGSENSSRRGKAENVKRVAHARRCGSEQAWARGDCATSDVASGAQAMKISSLPKLNAQPYIFPQSSFVPRVDMCWAAMARGGLHS